jgi:sterol desaturase/sphingolipid hydroxylase (fatty acid hydroxylase superfamily)
MDKKLLFIVMAVAVIFALEGVFPYYKGRTMRMKHAIPHVLTAIMNGLLTKFALAWVTIKTIGWAEGNSIGIAYLLTLPASVKPLLVYVFFDIWMYFWHKANHHIGFLWRFHRAHHSDIEMDTTTALRFHPGELILSTFFRLPVVILLGMSIAQLVFYETLLNLSTLFHHSNLAVPEKWDRILRTVVVTPNMHRVHHSVERFETDSNFTSLLSFWDRLNRTFRMRKDTHTISLGLPSFRESKYQQLWGFLTTPLR